MQQYDYFHGVKSRSDSRKGKANSNDSRSHSGTRRGNKRQSPRYRDVPDAPPDAYRNLQDKLSDGYRTGQDKSMPDRYRSARGKPQPDRYRNVQNKSLPDSSKNAPNKSFSESSRKVPDVSYPDSSRKVPDKPFPDSSRKVPDKSFPDSSRKVPDKSLPNSSSKVPGMSFPDPSRKMPDKSFPDSSKKELDKSFPDSSRKVPDKSLPDSSSKVPDKPFISRYKNVPGNRTGNSQHSLSTSHSSHRVGQSQRGSKSPVLRPPVIIPPVNVHPLPMGFMMRFPPPRFLQFPPGAAPYQTTGMTNDTFCDFDQYPSNLSQPPWENYQEMDESQFGFNAEFEPFPSSYSYWTNEAIEEPTTTSSTSDANLTTDYSIAYSDAFDEEYAVGFYTDAPLGECSAGHNTAEFHEGYSENSPRSSYQAVRPQFAPPATVMPVPIPVPHGIVSTNIQSFLPHFMLPKTTTCCQPEKHRHDASTNTPTIATVTTASTNTESKTTLSVGTNTETAELIVVSTNTDEVETRTVATGTELSDVPQKEMKSVATNTELPTNEARMVAINAALSDVMPTRETTDSSEIMQQSESGTSFGGAKPKRRPDSAIYTYGRSNEDETVDHSQDISRASSSGRVSSDLMSIPERSSGQCNVQKEANQEEEVSSCSRKLQSADLEGRSKTKRNLASKNDLEEVYYSDESDEMDELAKERRVSSVACQPDDHRFSALNSPDFFPKWASLIGTASSSPLSPASTAFKMPPSPDLTKLPGSPTGSLNSPYSTNPLPGFSLLHKAENQKFVSATSSPCSIGSGLASAAPPSLRSSLPLPPFIPESAGDASLVNTVLIENSALTRQIMMLLLKVNPLFALDPQAHRLAAFKELMLVRRCQFDMKLLQQRQKVPETHSQHQASWDNLQATQNNESSFGKTVVKEQELSNSQLGHCGVQQAGFNPANVPQRQQNPPRLEGWPPQYLENERPLARQPQQHLRQGQHKIYTGCNDPQTTEESYLRPDNERIIRVSHNHPSEEMEEKPFRQLRHQRRLVGTREGNSSWKDRFARQKDAGDWPPQTTNAIEIHQNDEHNPEKISELSEITVEDVSAKPPENSDEETWQKVCRKKKTEKKVKETGPKKFSRR